MINPKIRSDNSDRARTSRRQPGKTENPVGMRILEALAGRDYGWLSSETGIPASTISDYVQKGISRADNAVKIADALRVSLDWLLRGTALDRSSAMDASQADWVDVPEYNLQELSDEGHGPAIDSTPFRRDWLNRTFGTDKDLWLTALTSDYPALGLFEGDQVICRDINVANLNDRNLCIWRQIQSNRLMIGRFSLLQKEAVRHEVDPDAEFWIGPSAIAAHDTFLEVQPIGRILGRPLSPIR